MYKVKVTLTDKTSEEFYALDSYSMAEETMLYWNLESGDIVSFPIHQVAKIVEKEVEE